MTNNLAQRAADLWKVGAATTGMDGPKPRSTLARCSHDRRSSPCSVWCSCRHCTAFCEVGNLLMTSNTYPDLNAVDNIYRQNKAIMDASAKADRAKAMDELIAGDADLYDAPVAWLYDFGGFRAAYVNRHEDMIKKGYPETPLYASARIKGDKGRENPVERPQLEYNHTLEGTANFERALVEIERLTQALARANAQTEQFERDYYLKCDEHERDMKDAAAFMGKRDAEVEALTELAHQYLSDLRYPPAPDSKKRRIERIEAVLKQVQP